MNKYILSLVILFLLNNNTFSQISNKAERAIIQIYSANENNKSIGDHFLVKFIHPNTVINSPLSKYLIKRLSYNLFIVNNINSFCNNELAYSQKSNQLYKVSDNLVTILLTNKHSNLFVKVKFTDSDFVSSAGNYGKVIFSKKNYISLQINPQNLNRLIADKRVEFVDLIIKPKEEILINDIDLSANSIVTAQEENQELKGNGINISVKEDKFNINDLDLLGKLITTNSSSPNTSQHATIISTLIAGRGNSYIKGLGAAPYAKIGSSDFINLLPDQLSELSGKHIYLQNHSYGTSIENYYGIEALEYDKQIFENDSIIHVFSAGNIGNSNPTTGVYAGIANFSNLTGNFKQAKNIIVVGGTNRNNIVETLSSKGPAFDGRIKPDFVADGEDGTSGAAALTSGTIALLQQAYFNSQKRYPSSALVKCILINTAEKITANEVDYVQGYGKLNAYDAINTVKRHLFISGELSNNQQQEFNISLPPSVSKLKVTLAWNDPPSTVNRDVSLVNDLDLQVSDPANYLILPWTLSTYPNIDSLNASPQRHKDSLNNVEQITIDKPMAGDYKIVVKGSKVLSPKQSFYVVYNFTTANKFQFNYPSNNSQFFSEQVNYIRWKNSYPNIQGTLSVSYDNGSNWNFIAKVPLSINYCLWVCPKIFTKAILKMDILGTIYLSNPFTISSPLNLKVAFNCEDKLMLNWSKQIGSTGYNIYNINNDSLLLIKSSTDTSIIISKTETHSNFYAISAISQNNFEGLKSITINSTTQGVGCYVKALLADNISNRIRLTLHLGATTNLSKIIWQKQISSTTFISIGESVITNNQLDYVYFDTNPNFGKVIYKALLISIDGKNITSDLASNYVLKENQFEIYPNPSIDVLNILNGSNKGFSLLISDVTGKVVQNKKLYGLVSTISISDLAPGTYFATFKIDDKVVISRKMIKL